MKPYIVYWNNIPAPYMVERFNALADRQDFDIEAWFNDRSESDRSWIVDESSWRFRYRYLPTINIGRHRLHLPMPVLGKRPDVLVSLYAEPSFLIGWAVAKLRGAKTAFWCQVTNDRWVKRRTWKEALKRLIFPKVDATLGSGKESQAFAMRYGVPEEKALCLRHSIDVNHYASGREKYFQDRAHIRNNLRIQGTVFIYVGRLWSGKGVDYLLKAFDKVQKMSGEEVSLLLVGDGLQEAELQRFCVERGIRNVIFTGFQQKPELPRYYAAADVFVFPTLGDPYGLVIDEAMASSLPIISTSAAGEIGDRIDEGANGYIIPPGDSEALADRMLRLVNNQHLCQIMGKVSAEKIKGHTPEQWAKDFETIIYALLDEQSF